MLTDLDLLFVGLGLVNLHRELDVACGREDRQVKGKSSWLENYPTTDQFALYTFAHLVHFLNPWMIRRVPL